jgi:hypothetical protein
VLFREHHYEIEPEELATAGKQANNPGPDVVAPCVLSRGEVERPHQALNSGCEAARSVAPKR